MRVGFIGVSHWHSSEYLEGVKKVPFAEIVAISDKKEEVAEKAAKEYFCNFYQDYRKLLEKERLDFVFILGQHNEMPVILKDVVERRIAFCIEKPTAIRSVYLKPVLERRQKFSIQFLLSIDWLLLRIYFLTGKEGDSWETGLL